MTNYSMPIFLNSIEYTVRRYTSRKGELVLQDKAEKFKSEEVCIGNTIEEINNPKYNDYLKRRLEAKHSKTYGAEVYFDSVEPIVQCGNTTKRFK